jgi:hypothetical protein
MNARNFLRRAITLALFFIIAGAGTLWCAPVDEKEAGAVADLWYTMELNTHGPAIIASEKAARIQAMQAHGVLYLVEDKTLSDIKPAGKAIMAYVVTYGNRGYVVVSGDDRLDPVPVFDSEAEFRWDQPERNFLRYFLEKEMVKRWGAMKSKAATGAAESMHPNWMSLRSQTSKLSKPLEATFEYAPGGIYILWPTALWDQGQYYNEVVVAHNGNTADIPTGCTATAMAIKMRFHEWPPAGSGSHSYSDVWRSVRYSHSVDFGSHTYDWSSMPTGNVTAINAGVETLMYDCGVAVDMDYEVGTANAWPTATSMNTYFGYKGTVELTSSHNQPMIDSIRGGLPVVISSSAHTVVADGYRDSTSPYFHLNVGWSGGSNGWYNLDQIPGGDSTIDRSYPYSSPSNYVYVDSSWGGIQTGTIQNPWSSVILGAPMVPSGGKMMVKAGSYPGAVVLSTPMIVNSYQGEAVIGK